MKWPRWFAASLMLWSASSLRVEAATPEGEWYNTDIRGVEAVSNGACIRVWIEERTYKFVPAKEGHLGGTYGNVVRAVPVGLTGKDCRFPGPASNPLASQFRSWSIVGSSSGGDRWRVRAEPGLGGGDLQSAKTDSFDTTLVLEGDRLVDTPIGVEDANALVFRRVRMASPEAREALEETVRLLNGTACAKAMMGLVSDANPGAISDLCALRKQMLQLSGPLVSIALVSATEFDRVPTGFPRTAASTRERRDGILFSFQGRYEKSTVPGDAIVWKEGKTWRTVLLWF